MAATIRDELNSTTHKELNDVRADWRNAGDNLLTALVVGPGGLLYRLVVEPLPSGAGWDWTVWRPDKPPKTSRYGDAPDRAAAIAAAENQLRNWTAVEWFSHFQTDPLEGLALGKSERRSALLGLGREHVDGRTGTVSVK